MSKPVLVTVTFPNGLSLHFTNRPPTGPYREYPIAFSPKKPRKRKVRKK